MGHKILYFLIVWMRHLFTGLDVRLIFSFITPFPHNANPLLSESIFLSNNQGTGYVSLSWFIS